MSSEKPTFRIPPHITEAVIDEIEPDGSTEWLLRAVLTEARTEQPDLYRYLRETAQAIDDPGATYTISSSLAYEIVATYLYYAEQTIVLDHEDIRRHKQRADAVFSDPRFGDTGWVEERASVKDGTDVNSGIGLFLNIADSVAPELSGFMSDYLLALRFPEQKVLVLRGFYDGFMPFYSKIVRSAEPKL